MNKQLNPRELRQNKHRVCENLLQRCRCNAIDLTEREYQTIADIIYYGTRIIADEIYPFHRSVYDEDAGVFTDYGQNNPDRTWAQCNLVSLLTHAIITAEFDETTDDERGYDPNRKTITYILDMSIGAIVQAIHKMTCDDKLQKRVWMNKITGDYESDGHYGSASKQEYVESELKRLWVDRKTGRALIEKIQP